MSKGKLIILKSKFTTECKPKKNCLTFLIECIQNYFFVEIIKQLYFRKYIFRLIFKVKSMLQQILAWGGGQ